MKGLPWLLLLCCAAFALRVLWLIDATGLWTDELYTVGKVFSPALQRCWPCSAKTHTHPPLSYTLVWFWGHWLPQTAVSLRLLSWFLYLAGGWMITLQASALTHYYGLFLFAAAVVWDV